MTTHNPRYFTFTTEAPLIYDVCGQLISKDGFLHHRRTFELNVFILVTEGTLHITANNKAYSVSANQYIVLKAGEEHFGHQASEGRLSYLWVHFLGEAPIEVMSDTPQRLLDAPDLPTESDPYLFPEIGEVQTSKRVSFLFHQLLSLSLAENVPSPLMMNYTLSLLLMELSYDCSLVKKQASVKLPGVIPTACEWIRGNYYHPFTLPALAEVVGYQPDYLSTLFKKHIGVSVIEYANRLRIEAAKNLFANYDLSIKEAAYSCGFSDDKYFMKVFKKYEGMTPTEYKKTL